jgi:preprotein translocase subunit SecG
LPGQLPYDILIRLSCHRRGQHSHEAENREAEVVVSGFAPYIEVVQIIISIALIAVILVQAKGSGGLGGIFGGEGRGVYRTRRGVEKTLFSVTVGLACLFFVFSILSVIAA